MAAELTALSWADEEAFFPLLSELKKRPQQVFMHASLHLFSADLNC